MNIHPTSISLEDNARLKIEWSDAKVCHYSVRQLREACPCATCREKRRQPPSPELLPVLAPEEIEPLTITAMDPVGQYAYGITYSDGHDSGIYTFETLRALGESESQ